MSTIARIFMLGLALLALPCTTQAHEGKTHVMGVIERVESTNLVVNDTTGRPVTIALTPETRYFADKQRASHDDIEAGQRVAVDVSGTEGDYSALEVHLGKKAPIAADSSPDQWTCSMHPEVRATEPGRCPVCNMNLVPSPRREQKNADEAANSHDAGNANSAHHTHNH